MFRSSILINYVCMSVFFLSCVVDFIFLFIFLFTITQKVRCAGWPLHQSTIYANQNKKKKKKKKNEKKHDENIERREKYLEVAFEFSEILVNFLEL